MVYIETTDKEKSILKSLCDIEKIEDILYNLGSL